MIRRVFHFVQECPVCGRSLEMDSEHDGRRVCCGHCRGVFVACGPKRGRSGSDCLGSLRPRGTRLPARAAAPGAPKVLLAEYRDEVFARLATDLAQAGLHVIRAAAAQEANERHAKHRPILAIVNRDLPDESGWLLVEKLYLMAPAVRVWVYQPSRSAADVAMARFLGVDELVDYGGDLLRLSDAILDCLAGRVPSPRQSLWQRRVSSAGAA